MAWICAAANPGSASAIAAMHPCSAKRAFMGTSSNWVAHPVQMGRANMNLGHAARNCLAALLCAVAPAAHAHGFGQRYDLPLPLTLYLCGAALTVTLSCVMLAIFVQPRHSAGDAAVDLLAHGATRWIAAPAVVAVVRFIAVALYLLLLAAGFFGRQDAFHNIVPITVWALWWVGVGYASVFVGDVWRIANPLATLFAAAE